MRARRYETYPKGYIMQKLTGRQVRHLRGLGHHLHPVVMIGKEEVSESLIRSVEEALDAHELIKVKIQEGCMLDRKEAAEMLAERSGAAVVQILGKTILLFRRSPEGKVELP
jgi:RNA-binding protein